MSRDPSHRDMLGRPEVVTVEEALRIFYESFRVPALESEELPVMEVLGRVTWEDVISGADLPGFARSSMDGYAVIASDTYGATESLPAYLKVAGEVPMGEEAETPARRGHAIRISTGGMLPPGADAVVILEDTQPFGPREIEVTRPVALGENVVRAGDDIKEGETVLATGHRLRPQDLGALAGIGVTRLRVFRKPRVAIINTGNEIIDAAAEPKPGQIRDVNSYNLSGLVRQSGGEPALLGIYRDEYEPIRDAVEKGLKAADVVALTGGSSVGAGDLAARVIDELGGPGVLVHGVAVKPGKPVIIGICNGKPVFGLPGHPVAVSVSFDIFMKPLLKRLSGEVDPLAAVGVPPVRVVRARMARNYSSSQGREDHIRVALEMRDGELWAKPVLGKSGLISTLVKAHGTVVVGLGRIGLEKGEWVEVSLFE